MTKQYKCDCHSYNGDFGSIPERILKAPKSTGKDTICVDECIADVLQHLWTNNIPTLSSCCGHNGVFGVPSIVLGEGVENYTHVRELIKVIDDRHFELTQWKRVII